MYENIMVCASCDWAEKDINSNVENKAENCCWVMIN